MTKKKQTNRLLIPVVILAVLVLVMLIATDPFGWMKPAADTPDEDAPETTVLCAVAAADITAFEITKPGDGNFRIERTGENWQVKRREESFRANMEKVDKLIADMPGLKSGSTATDKASKHAKFEVDIVKAVDFKVYTGGAEPATHLLVGKADDSYAGAYVRLSGQDKVYRADKNIKSLVGFSFQDYCSKVPWEFDPLAAERFTVAPPTGEGESLEFQRNDGIWQTPAGANGNQNLINGFLDALSKLRVSSFADDSDPELSGLTDTTPAVSVTVSGVEYQLIVGTKEESQYFVADQDGHAYRLSEYNLKPYLELAFSELAFDDVIPEPADGAAAQISGEMEPDEGIANGLPSDIDE